MVAIAIHNIPEGIAVSVPIYHATGSKGKAFRYSFLSGLAEPVGALIGWLLLMPIMSDLVFGILFAGVAGIMVFISLDELLPLGTGVRGASSLHLRPDLRHGRHGDQPALIFINPHRLTAPNDKTKKLAKKSQSWWQPAL